MSAEFRSTSGKGFHITLDSGYTLSVQFGGGNYCANRQRDVRERDLSSPDAEIAVWRGKGGLLPLPGGDSVVGWVTPAQVLDILVALSTADESADLVALLDPILREVVR